MIMNYFFGSRKKSIMGILLFTFYCMYLFRIIKDYDETITTIISWLLISAIAGVCMFGSLLIVLRFFDFIIECFQDIIMNKKFIRVFRELWFINLGWKRLAIALWIISSSILGILIMNDGYSINLFELLFGVAVFTVIYWCAVLCINWIINGFVKNKQGK